MLLSSEENMSRPPARGKRGKGAGGNRTNLHSSSRDTEAGKHLLCNNRPWLAPFHAPFHKTLREEENKKLSPSFPPSLYSFGQVVTSH